MDLTTAAHPGLDAGDGCRLGRRKIADKAFVAASIAPRVAFGGPIIWTQIRTVSDGAGAGQTHRDNGAYDNIVRGVTARTTVFVSVAHGGPGIALSSERDYAGGRQYSKAVVL